MAAERQGGFSAEALAAARAGSRFLDEALKHHPDWAGAPEFAATRRPGETARRLRELTAQAADEATLMRVLRQQREREMARIALRELSGAAQFDETLRDLSDLADACCAIAVDFAERELVERYGVPRDAKGGRVRPVVLGMGKLGGCELNFSSDIDLIVAYSAPGHCDGAKALDNELFFARLVQSLSRLLSERTEHGFVFRVDLMLRPFGASGPAAISFPAAEQYYQVHGREWERYALIKARPVAGDVEAGRVLLSRLQPFVYRRYLDFTALGSLRELKRRIREDVVQRGDEDSIKLGEGGIRELEFIVQSFQLVRGGQDARLRDTRLRPTLRRLAEIGLIPAQTATRLDECYRFLRRLENAVQMYADQQTHMLPEAEAPRRALLAAMREADWAALTARYQAVRRFVHEEFQRVFAAPQQRVASAPWAQLVETAMTSADAALAPQLRDLGFDQASATELARLLRELARSRRVRVLPESAAQRLQALLARLLQDCMQEQEPALAARRILKVVDAIVGRSTYLSLLQESDTARRQLIRLCAISPWITDFIAQSPATLDMLLDVRQLYAPPTARQMHEELRARIEALGEVDDGGQAAMDALRRYRQETMLRIAAADVAGVLPLVEVSDRLTWLAEAVLQQALNSAQREMRAQFGLPPDSHEDGTARIAAIGYGKFGGIELGYGSDLDLVFVYEAASLEADTVGGARSLSTAAWFARLVQRLIHWLSTLTPAGRCYEVDLELRPSGRSGLIVSTFKSFSEYQRRQAWTWEHQALTRARFVAGDAALGQAFEALRREVLCTPRDAGKLRAEVLDMRERIRSRRARRAPGRWDMKLDAGGLVDIEFITQYLILREAPRHPALARWSDNWRQLDALSEAGVIEAGDKAQLIEVYRAYRQATHAAALQQQEQLPEEAPWRSSREAVIGLWRRVFALAADDRQAPSPPL